MIVEFFGGAPTLFSEIGFCKTSCSYIYIYVCMYVCMSVCMYILMGSLIAFECGMVCYIPYNREISTACLMSK